MTVVSRRSLVDRARTVAAAEGWTALGRKVLGTLLSAILARDSFLVLERATACQRLPSPPFELRVLRSAADVDAVRAAGKRLLPEDIDELDGLVSESSWYVGVWDGDRFVHRSIVCIGSGGKVDIVGALLTLRDAAYIGRCFTDPDYRGRGVYSAVLGRICAELDAVGVARAVLTVGRENEASLRGVAKAGFIATAEGELIRTPWRTAWRQRSIRTIGRIVLFHTKLVNPGGAERFLIEEYRFLKSCGVALHVLSFGPCDEIACYGERLPELEILSGKRLPARVLGLRRRLRELNPDMVITASGLRTLYLATRLGGPPYLLHQHEPPLKEILAARPRLFLKLRRRQIAALLSAPLYQFMPSPNEISDLGRRRIRGEFQALLDALAVRAAIHVTVLSHQAAREVRLVYGRSAQPSRGAIRTSEASPLARSRARVEEEPRLLLSISRLHRLKRIDLMIDALEQLRTRRPNVRLAIGGVGSDEGRLRGIVEELGLSSVVDFVGFIPDDDLPIWYARADVFLLAEWADFDIAPYEALARGCVVVCSTEMEIEPELVDGGFVVPADPVPEAFASGIERALDHRPECLPDLSELTWSRHFDRALAPIGLPRASSAKAPHGEGAVVVG